MDGAACNIVPCLQCALMRVEALIFGEERWMNVEHPALPFAYEFRGEQAHVTGEGDIIGSRSEEHTSELQSLMRISYAVFCLKKKTTNIIISKHTSHTTLNIILKYNHRLSDHRQHRP